MAASPLNQLRQRLAPGGTDPGAVAEEALACANGNASRNTYISLAPGRTLAEAASLPRRFPEPDRRPLLFGIPVSIKDCYDMEGFPTSCGSRYYAARNGIAKFDSALAARLRHQGAIITGKTHLHQLAYGITGENRDYGDCVQPRNAAWLTGGSSSGAAASIQEGSAVAAIGTDTGGSIRVPAALCGLAGYRSSLGTGSWQGAAHLAPSFDTIGCLFRDLRDGPTLAQALFDVQMPPARNGAVRIGVAGAEFLHDCEPLVLEVYEFWKRQLQHSGAQLSAFDTGFWEEAMEIFAPIQAHEAAAIHRGHFPEFETPIAERLAWGESLPLEEIGTLRTRHASFTARMNSLLRDFDFLVVPCAPVSALAAGANHAEARRTILRYTTPMSLAGVPVVVLPGDRGGVQLVAARGHDARLLAYSAHLGEKNAYRV